MVVGWQRKITVSLNHCQKEMNFACNCIARRAQIDGVLWPGSLVSSQVVEPFDVWQAMERCPCPREATCQSPQDCHPAAPRATHFHGHLQRPSEERGIGGNVFVSPFPCLEEMRQRSKKKKKSLGFFLMTTFHSNKTRFVMSPTPSPSAILQYYILH